MTAPFFSLLMWVTRGPRPCRFCGCAQRGQSLRRGWTQQRRRATHRLLSSRFPARNGGSPKRQDCRRRRAQESGRTMSLSVSLVLPFWHRQANDSPSPNRPHPTWQRLTIIGRSTFSHCRAVGTVSVSRDARDRVVSPNPKIFLIRPPSTCYGQSKDLPNPISAPSGVFSYRAPAHHTTFAVQLPVERM